LVSKNVKHGQAELKDGTGRGEEKKKRGFHCLQKTLSEDSYHNWTGEGKINKKRVTPNGKKKGRRARLDVVQNRVQYSLIERKKGGKEEMDVTAEKKNVSLLGNRNQRLL